MASRALVSGLPRSLPPLPPGPAPTCVPCVEGRQRAAPHSSSFPPTEAPLQTLHMDVWGPARVRGQGHERYFLLVVDDYSRYTTVFPLRSKDRGEEFSSDLLRAFCRLEGIRQTFTLPASPQQNGIAERRIGMVMDVARTSMIHAAAPHFLWPFAVQYAAHHINLQPRVSLPETTPTLRWTGKVGDASAFRVWGSRAFVRDTTADKLSSHAVPYVFLGFPPDAPGWQFYHPTSRRVLSSQDVTFDESVSYYHPAEPVEVAVDSGAARGAESGGAEAGRAEPAGVAPEGTVSGGAEPARAAPGGALGVPSRREPLSPLRLREWYSRRCRFAAGAGVAGAGAAGVAGGAAGVPGGADATKGPAGAGAAGGAAGATGGAGAAGGTLGATGGAGASAAGGGAETGVPGAEGTGSVSAVSGGAARPRPYFVPLLQQVLGSPPSPCPPSPPFLRPSPVQSQSQLQPASPLTGPSPYSGPTRGLTERREPESRPVSPESRPASPVRPVRAGHVSRPRLPPVPGTHSMTLRPSTAPQHVPLPSSPASSLPDGPDPESDSLRAARPSVTRFLATTVTDPLFESSAASALVAELVDFAAACRLDYGASLVAESVSASVCPPSVGGESALGTDVLEDRQEDLECFAAASPHLVSMLLAPEGDPDALDIPTPRSYAEAIEGPYSSQWQAAMDAEMASWKSTGTYVDKVPPPGANIVSGMWIFRVKRPPGSPPAFKARYVARGFSQRQGVDFFQTFSPTPKMTTLRWSLRRPVYGLRQAPREWHDTLTTLASLGFSPSTADPSLFLRTDATLPPFYVLVYVDDLVFATADTEALALVKSELQKRHTCTDLGELTSYLGLQITRDRAQRTITLTQSHMVQQVLQRFGFTYSSPQSTPLPTGHSLSAPPSDESVELSGPYLELVGCLITSGMGLVLGGRARVVLTGHADASWVDDLATQRSSQGYTFSLGSGSVSWRSTRSSSVLSSNLLKSGVDIFDLHFDAILSAMYALSVSAEGDCYWCVPPDPGIDAAALGASESVLPGTVPAEALHTFTLDSGTSRCFFRDSTSLTPLPAPVLVRLADPFGGPFVARSSTGLPCPAIPSGSLSGLHLPSFSTNLVSTAALQDAMVSASSQVPPPCSCRLLSHQTLLWHHRLGPPYLPRLRGMHSRLLISGLPRSLPPLPPSLAPLCLPCVEGRQPRVTGQGRKRYFLLVVNDYTWYTTLFPLRSKGQVVDVLIPWIRTVRLQLRERFSTDLPVLHLHSDRGGEFSSDLLRDFCRGEGILQSFMLPASPQQNGIAERRIGLVMEVARTSMIHAAAPHFLWPFAVRYATHQLNLLPRVSLPETSLTLCWTGKVGDASVFRVYGSLLPPYYSPCPPLSGRQV
ncbi:unnamed protein product [Closterium sp. NIES-53]